MNNILFILSILEVISIILFIIFSPAILNIMLNSFLDGFSTNDPLCEETDILEIKLWMDR